MMRLLLVRHCESLVDPATPPSTWGLSEEGTEKAKQLASLPVFANVASAAAGDEPKLLETLRPLASAAGLEVAIDPRFAESHSDGWFDDATFHMIVAKYFEAPMVIPATGWEPSVTAADRFLSGIKGLVHDNESGDAVVCSGGRVLTAVLGSLGLLGHEKLHATWQTLRMPDLAVVELIPNAKPTLIRPPGKI